MQCIPTSHVYPRIVFKPMKMKNRLRSASVEDTAELSPEYKQIVDFVTHGWSSVKLEMEQGDVWKYHQDNKQRSAKATIDCDCLQRTRAWSTTRRSPTRSWRTSPRLTWTRGGGAASTRTSPPACDRNTRRRAGGTGQYIQYTAGRKLGL